MTIQCCKSCTDRYAGCHDVCESYISERAEIWENKDKIFKQRMREKQIDDFVKDQVIKAKKRCGK